MHSTFHRAVPWILLLSAAALLPACKSLDVPKVPGVTPYRMVIQQGNFISQEMVSQLKPGMTKEQVRFILGTPLVNDIFHADRWDYVFFREGADGKREQRNLSVVFEKDKLARVLGDLLPSDGSGVKSSGFDQQVKPGPVKPEPVKPEPAKSEPVKPEPVKSEPVKPEPVKAEAAAKPAAQPAEAPAAEAPRPEDAAAPKAAQKKAAEDDKERGFFGRMLEKIGL
jgi:outer membrane protein assembly factor BamE